MASPLKFILDLDAKLGATVGAAKVLRSIEGSLLKIDPGLKRTARAANLFGQGVGTGLRGAWTGLGLLRQGINAVGDHAMKGLGDSFKNFLGNFTALAAFHGFQALASGALGLGKSLVTTVAQAERADAVLTSLVGPQKAKMIDELANRISASTEFDDDALKSYASGLLRVGFAFDKLPRALALGADIAALTDADPAQTLAEVGDTLQSIQQKGGLNFKMLGNLGITKKDFFGDLGKQLGISMEDAEARAQKGSIKLDTIFNQIQKSVGKVSKKPLGAVALERGAGLSATFARLQRVPDDLFKSFKGTQASADLAQGFARLGVLLGPDGPVGSKIVAGLGGALATVGKWLATVDFDKVMGQLSGFAESASQVFGVFSSVFKFVAGVFDAVGTAIGEVTAEIFLEVEKLMNIGTAIGEFFGSIEVWITDWGTKLFEGAKLIGGRIWQGMKEGITAGISSVGGAMSGLLDNLMGTTESDLEIHSPSRVFERYGLMTGEGFAKGLGTSMRDLDGTPGLSLGAPSADLGIGMGVGKEGGGAITVNVPITVNYTGAGGPEAAKDLADAIKDILPGQLQQAFMRLQTEMGTV